jgi:hypothetical protein
MKEQRKAEQYLRLVAGGSATLFMILTIFLALMKLTLSCSIFCGVAGHRRQFARYFLFDP